MSFDKITDGRIAKSKEVKILHGGKEYKFTAKELSFIAAQEIAIKRHAGEPWLVDMIVSAIVDESGRRMTTEQAEKLSPEHAEQFLAAALEVNKAEEKK